MTEIFNKAGSKNRRQDLRNNMTQAEIILWSKLKGKQFCGLKFRRQCGIHHYVVDFYCPELKLVIEVDGQNHGVEAQRVYDQQRQKEIEALGIKVLRFTNNEITFNIEQVLNEILLTTPSPPS